MVVESFVFGLALFLAIEGFIFIVFGGSEC
jgi:hypothetical protein